MPLPKLPVTGLDDLNHRRRARETINQVLDHSFDDWKVRTAAEIAAGVTTINQAYPVKAYDLRRAGLVANSASAAASNRNALKNLIDPTVSGPPGRYILPNIGGNDVYYIDDLMDMRSLIRLDLDDSVLHMSASRVASHDKRAVFTILNDVLIENGTINMDYDGTGGTAAGMILRIGSRDTYPYGSYTNGILDQDDLIDNDLPYMGNCTFRNLRLITNNPSVSPVVMLGGLRNVLFDNVTGDGSSAPPDFFYYEFGAASTNGFASTTAKWSSSHARNLQFRNIDVRNLDTSVTNGAAIHLVGSYNTVIDGLAVTNSNSGIVYRPGEAMFYRPWTDEDDVGGKRSTTIRNVVCTGLSGSGSTALFLQGAQDNDGGYLNDTALVAAGLSAMTDEQKTNLMTFSVDGVAAYGGGAGAIISGRTIMRNASFQAGSADGIVIYDECPGFSFDNIRVRDFGGHGIRANIGLLTDVGARNKMGSIRNSQIAGNTSTGIIVDNAQGVQIDNCLIGYTTEHDGAAESVQGVGVSVSSNASGVVCTGCTITTSGGAVAYANAGSSPRGNAVHTPFGTKTTSGIWEGITYNWTATLAPGTSGSITPVTGQDVGRLVILDNVVHATLYYGVNTVSSPTGTLTLSGLTIGSANNLNGRTSVTIFGQTLGASCTGLTAQLGTNATSFAIFTRFSAGSWSSNAADIVNNTVLVVSLTYVID